MSIRILDTEQMLSIADYLWYRGISRGGVWVDLLAGPTRRRDLRRPMTALVLPNALAGLLDALEGKVGV